MKRSAFGGLVALVCALVVVGVLTVLTPTSLPSQTWVRPGADGVARTRKFDVTMTGASTATRLMGEEQKAFATSQRFVVVNLTMTPTRETLNFVRLRLVTRDGYTYNRLGWYGLNDTFTLYAGTRYQFSVVFELPPDKIDGAVLHVGPEVRESAVQTLEDGAELPLPQDLPYSENGLTITKVTQEAAG